MELRDLPIAMRALRRAGVFHPVRPDRLIRAAAMTRHWGLNYAGGFAAAASRFPERTCVVDERGHVTWGELDRRSNAIANSLGLHGVHAGDVVGLMCRNHRGFVEATSALAKLGATALLLNTSMAGPQLRDIVLREGADAIIFDGEFSELVPADFPVELGVEVGDPGTRDATWPTLTRMAEDGSRIAPPRPAVTGRTVILTSGTTGTPKGASRKQSAGIDTVVAMLDRIPYRQNDTMVVPAPLFHSWGFTNLTVGMLLGATLVLRPRFDPEEVLADVARHRASVLVAVPVMLQRILALPERVRRRYDASSLRVVPLSGSAIPADIATRWMDEFGDNIYNLYGSTEVGWATIATPDDLRADPGTAGRPPLYTSVRILDDEGREKPVGETGRIFVGSDLLFEGYTGGGGKEVRDGLMSTGDTGYLDRSGRLHVRGRDDEMIVSGGENVFPREVEDLLAARPDVAEAAVIGVEDDEFGQRLKAFVVPASDAELDEAELKDHVGANLARFKVPREVVVLDELPRNPTGKVLKRELS